MVGIIDYGAGNLRSLSNALTYIGVEHIVTNDYDFLKDCSHLILPGVGSFMYGMVQLQRLTLVDFLKTTNKPLLGICLGMQLMATMSEEDGKNWGLNKIPGEVRKLPEPHVGWEEWEGKDYYFVHHYAIKNAPWVIRYGNLWACQFHPEKSQEAGLAFLKEFCES